MIVTPANSPEYYNSTNRLDTSNLQSRNQTAVQGQTSSAQSDQTSSASQAPAYKSSVSSDTMGKFNAYDSNKDGVMSVSEFSVYKDQNNASAYSPVPGYYTAPAVPAGYAPYGYYYNNYA
ncbi:MAG: hypothetical protein AB7F25_05480 [Deferribacterales bacterium]